MRIRTLAALLVGLLALGPTTAPARSLFAQATLDTYFNVDWQVVRGPRGPVVEGFVYNRYGQATDRMRLDIEQLDGTGNVVGRTTTWVMGGVPPNGRTWFSAPVPDAAGYRVDILSFDWVGRGN
jgi:hypothetical protein